MGRLYWASFLRTWLVYGGILAGLVLAARAMGIYFLAAILLLLLFLYRKEILDPGRDGRPVLRISSGQVKATGQRESG